MTRETNLSIPGGLTGALVGLAAELALEEITGMEIVNGLLVVIGAGFGLIRIDRRIYEATVNLIKRVPVEPNSDYRDVLDQTIVMPNRQRHGRADLAADPNRRLGQRQSLGRFAVDPEDLVAGADSSPFGRRPDERRDHRDHVVDDRQFDPDAAELSFETFVEALPVLRIEELAVGVFQMLDDALHRAVEGLLIVDPLRLIEVAPNVLVDLIDGCEQVAVGLLDAADSEGEDEEDRWDQHGQAFSPHSPVWHSFHPYGSDCTEPLV